MKNNNMKNLKYYIILIATTVLFGVACGNKKNTEVAEKNIDSIAEEIIVLSSTQFNNAGIVLAKPVSQNINQKIKTNGKLDVPPQNLISISAPYGGFLKSTNLLEGMHVHKGEVIAQMEHPDYIQLQQDYLENKSTLTYLKNELDRQLELAKEEVNSRKTLQKAKTDFEVMQARVNGLRAKLELIQIDVVKLEKGNFQKTVALFSPINGYVTKVNVNIGAFVTANTVLFEIVDTEHLHAEISVFEKDIQHIKIGQKVAFTLANENQERFAKVHLIGREISEDRTVRVHCHLNKEDKDLLPGMYLTAYIDVKANASSTLPNNAFVDFEGKSYVFLLSKKLNDSYAFTRVEVEKFGEENGFTAFTSTQDLSNKNIVTEGAYKLLSAMQGGEEE
jgi:cobalt-zinc-cadmium efflux system membrane fusion protein